jgi:hypothetical protein
VPTEDVLLSYLALVPSLHSPNRLDLRGALEFGGGARAYGPEGKGVVYVTSSEEGTLTEVRLAAGAELQAGSKVSFGNLGISSTTGGNVHHFVSPRKAYFVSQDTLEIVVWNPEEMAIQATIPLELADQLVSTDGYFYFYPRPIVVENKLVILANQSSLDDIDGPTVVTVIDTETDEVISTTVEPRCHGLLVSALDARGDRYFASSDYSAAVHFLRGEAAPEPCMIRMLFGETEFDADWSRTLSDALHSDLWTGVTQGPRSTLIAQALARDAPGLDAASEPYEITILPAWRWYSLATAEASGEALAQDFLNMPPSFAPIEIDGDAYVALMGEQDTTLVDLTSSDEPSRALEVPGFVFNVVRVR